ncbi:SAM-dependent methyltransferase [Kineococcus radiotolerans]|uniref:SAM-dependent methyltransferase n=1 Tax=Kineococcus radiotolerans TaxID=131568 RepID=A0A7W4TMU3_KINRA|nr:class I SAM-dependent methyltransferase [Kineococcus radiotolerans]MBB2901166.1 SAM-dependent methyltransferase [Kineococcus radiotolerans]
MPNFDLTARDARELWEGMYSSGHGHVWSGRPNPALVDAIADLTPGTALDLGCGEGGDVLHLARLGWRVTGVDVSDTAIARAAAHAAEAGVGDLTRFERHDLGQSFPAGLFDLVTASFLHSFAFLDRTAVLARAARSVAPGGSLLVLGHHVVPEEQAARWRAEGAEVDLPSPGELRRRLALPEAEWTVARELLVERTTTGEDGSTAAGQDGVLRLDRR